MSTVSSYSQDLVVRDKRSSEESSATAKYYDLVRSSDIFREKLLGLSEKPLKIPTMGGNDLDLHRLFVEVTSRGGMAKVSKDRKWKEVMGALNFPTTLTSASFVLKKYYNKFLYQMEHVYYLQKPASSIQTTKEAMKSLSPKGTDDEPKWPVHGVIDGKFHSGYLVTMNMGSQVMKGVIFHVAETPSQPQQTLETTSAMAPSEKKKAKVAVDESQKSNGFWSGYNFFFAEQYARLKPEYHGKQTIPKIIGQMWGNLSQSEKQVYEDKGVKDVERYRTDMMEYKSAHESGASAGATVAQ